MRPTHAHIYHTTSYNETLEPHVYVDAYTDPYIKNLVHAYKFTHDMEAKKVLLDKTLDLCMYNALEQHIFLQRTCTIYTAPPSTMFERGEKDVDSMFELIRGATFSMHERMYISKSSLLSCMRVFSISGVYLRKQRAQHIGGSRKSRTTDIEHRYTISSRHKLWLWWHIHVRNIYRFSYIVIDDVSSTGSTLVASTYTLRAYFKKLQKKNPHIVCEVKIYSLVH